MAGLPGSTPAQPAGRAPSSVHTRPWRLSHSICRAPSRSWRPRRQAAAPAAACAPQQQLPAPSGVRAARAEGTAQPRTGSSTSVGELPFFPDRRLVEDIPLPALRDCRHFVNLTNGIEALPHLQRLGLPYSFVRIQSTSCEQQLFEKVLAELDSTLLLHLALGHCCLVYDFGSRNKKRGAPRAVWYGLEFIRYALTRMWLPGAPAEAYLRGYSVAHTFESHVRKFSKSTKRRLQYFGKYLPPGGLQAIQLYGVYSSTEHDDDFEFFRHIVHSTLPPLARPAGAQAEAAGRGADSLGGAESSSSGGSSSTGVVVHPADVRSQQGLELEQRLAPEEVEQLLQGNIHQAAEALLGMRLFLGGISHATHHAWQRSMHSVDSVASSDEELAAAAAAAAMAGGAAAGEET